MLLIAGALAATTVGCASNGGGMSVVAEPEQNVAEGGEETQAPQSDAENVASSEALEAFTGL